MIGAFYSTSRIPVTLPIIIAITALLPSNSHSEQGKRESLLWWRKHTSCAAYLISKDRHSLMKLKNLREDDV